MNLIFLDDERDLEDVTWINYPEFNNVDIVRTFEAFKTKVQDISDWNNVYFSFDHDIQDFNEDKSENTGYTCVKWLCDYILDNNINYHILNVFIHTQNPIGAKNIKCYFENFNNLYRQK